MKATKNGSRITKEHLDPIEITQELGVTGLKQSAGTIHEQPMRALKGKRALKVWTQMARYDEVVRAMLLAVEMLIRQVPWRVDPGGDQPQDQEAADFIDGARNDMSSSWEDTLAEILSMLWAGWSYHELVYKLRRGGNTEAGQRSRFNDGKIGWRKIPIRSQDSLDRWEISAEDGGLDGMWQRDPNHGGPTAFIPIEKALLFRPTIYKGDPEGRSMLEGAYTAWFYKTKLQTIEAIGIERDAAGIPIAWVPPNLFGSGLTATQTTSRDTFRELITNIRADEQQGILMPLAYDENNNKLYDLTLLQSSGRRTSDTSAVIKRYNNGIAGSMLADFILLGHEAVGSFALSDSKTELFSVSLGAIMDSIAAVFNRHAIPRILALNGMPVETPPTLVHGDIETIDLDKLGKFILDTSSAGARYFPDDKLENHLREMTDLPPLPEEGFPVVVPALDEG